MNGTPARLANSLEALPQDGTSQYKFTISAIENLHFAEFEVHLYDANTQVRGQ
jgi:hypothetical protein